MKPEHQTLWIRIQNAALVSETVDRHIEQKLAQERGWSRPHAGRVMHEYRRFLLLAVATDHAVSPPDPVDQVWHLHVLHTRAYHAYCRDVLGQALHHEPNDGQQGTSEMLRKQYAATVSSYSALFGEPPPNAIWGETNGQRCAQLRQAKQDARVARVLELGTVAVLGGCLAMVPYLLFAARGIAAAITDPYTSWLLIISCLACAALMYKHHRGPPVHSGAGYVHLRPYEIAYLAGGQERLWSAVLARLRMHGLVFSPDGRGGVCVTGQLPEGVGSIEQAALEQLSKPAGAQADMLVAASLEVRDRLAGLGLLVPESANARIIATRLLVVAALLVMFSHLFLVAAAGWCLAAVALVTVTGVLSVLCHSPPLRSPHGDAVLRGIEHAWPKTELERLIALSEGEQKADAITLLVALFGNSTSACAPATRKGIECAGWGVPSVLAHDSQGDAPGCGAGCSGSSDGGCGGCGGCGG